MRKTSCPGYIPRDSLRETLKVYLSRGGGVPPPLCLQPRRGSQAVRQQNLIPIVSTARVRPNPSLKRTHNGIAVWPSSAGASPHFALAIQPAMPLRAA